jgi:two-component system sensor histidine kinase UhpB
VRVQVARAADAALSLQVRDDGVGMAAQQAPPRPGLRGLGLLGAAERAAALGGTLRVDSAPGAGTTLRLSLPAPLPASQGPA